MTLSAELTIYSITLLVVWIFADAGLAVVIPYAYMASQLTSVDDWTFLTFVLLFVTAVKEIYEFAHKA